MKKATKKEVLEMAIKQEEKYVELVWFARSGRNLHIPAVVLQRERIEKMYPEEVKKLQGEWDWEHGFNSGMLAGMRLITSMMEVDVEHAEENFPELDS